VADETRAVLDAERATEADEPRPAAAWVAVCRGVALALGTIAWLNLLSELRRGGVAVNLWWIDLPPVPRPLATLGLMFSAVVLIAFAVFPRMPRGVRLCGAVLVLGLFGLAVRHALATSGASDGLPFSLHIAAALAVVLAGLLTGPRPIGRPWRDGSIAAVAFSVCVLGFPLAQMWCFGQCDQRRRADAALGFGSDTDAATDPETAERLRVATSLHRQEHVLRLLVGRDIEAVRAAGVQSVLVVAPPERLPRMVLALRQRGITAHGVPVPERRPPAARWRTVLRESAALWLYFLRPATT
jgi:hypothetical protein